MLKIRKKTASPPSAGTIGVKDGRGGSEWEVRPGGMLVQKRNSDSDRVSSPPAPTIRVRVKYGSTYHEIAISSQSTFGELKKMLSGPTGLHHQDQKLYYKDKERESSSFLDIAGIKDKSKLLLMEDPISHEKRLLEMRKNAKMEKASKSIAEISLEVDRLAGQVSAMKSIMSKGEEVVEKDVLSLIELLMNQLLKLDGIIADGDAKLQRKMQVRRVQKYVETLDLMKARTTTSSPTSKTSQLPAIQERKDERKVPSLLIDWEEEHSSPATAITTVVTTQWETFDSAPNVPTDHNRPQFPWDF